MVLSPTLLETEGPVKHASGASSGPTKTSLSTQRLPLVCFATAGSKGSIRVWTTHRPHPLHALEPLTRSLQEGEEGEGEGVEAAKEALEGETAVSTYVGLHYNETLEMLAAVTYDQNIIIFDSRQFTRVKQVRDDRHYKPHPQAPPSL